MTRITMARTHSQGQLLNIFERLRKLGRSWFPAVGTKNFVQEKRVSYATRLFCTISPERSPYSNFTRCELCNRMIKVQRENNERISPEATRNNARTIRTLEMLNKLELNQAAISHTARLRTMNPVNRSTPSCALWIFAGTNARRGIAPGQGGV